MEQRSFKIESRCFCFTYVSFKEKSTSLFESKDQFNKGLIPCNQSLLENGHLYLNIG